MRIQRPVRLYAALALILVLSISYAVFRQFNPNIGFAYYEPTYLPPHVSIKAKLISMGHPGPIAVEQNFRTEDWVYSIREVKAETEIGTADQDYDPTSVKPTCNIQTSPAKMRYRLCHWIDYGHIDVHEIMFRKGDTFITVMMPTSLDNPLRMTDIDHFVDSFEKKSTIGLPVLRLSGGA